MNPLRRNQPQNHLLVLSTLLLTLAHVPGVYADPHGTPRRTIVQVRLSEWSVALTPSRIPPGPVEFDVTNAGTIPHAFEIEGGRIEKSVPQLQPGATARLELTLTAANYEAYCPVGKGSHKMLGMVSHLAVGHAKSAPSGPAASGEHDMHDSEYGAAAGHEAHGGDHDDEDAPRTGPRMMTVVGGGPVIQILPGPFPFADSAMAVIRQRPADQQQDLTKKAHMGLYSDHVASIQGDIALVAIDRGATGDSVSGTANFTGHDGARWKVVIDRVQTKDIPFNPRFGGVIMGLFYHGASGVHTPLVPTIQSSLALWAYAHLYRNDQLVTDDAMVHIMLLSRTRRTSDWALDCWDCSDRPIEELQLQVTPPPNAPPFESDGGALFVNWEKSTGKTGTP
jgi:hypothetical protein